MALRAIKLLKYNFRDLGRRLSPSKTYHVAQNDPNAADTNDGSEISPFKIFSKAASILKASEAIEVHEGVYREWMKPVNGSIFLDKMIWYYAAKGEEVIIKGSDEWSPRWVKTRYIGRDKKYVTSKTKF